MRRSLLTAALFLSLAALPAAADDPAALKGDLAKIQGTWQGKLGPAEDVPVSYTFKGDAVTITLTLAGAKSRTVTLRGKIRLDEAATPHKTVDWLALTDSTGKSVPDQPGLYALVGDNMLRICNGRAGLPRPINLPDGPPTIVLTRVKDEPKSK
jgi:uncharacterized protein (TIGR03067 family)